MIEALHVGALVPATVGLCCTAASPRRRGVSAVAGWAPAAVMTAAMADLAFGSPIVPAVLWTVLLLIASVLPAAHLRHGRVVGDRRTRAHAPAMTIHRSLGTLVMAGLMLVMATAAPGVRAATTSHHGGGGGGIEWMLASASIAFLALSAWLLARVLREPRPLRLAAGEIAAMALSVGVTAAALLV